MRWVLLKVILGASEGITNFLTEAFFICGKVGKVLGSVTLTQRQNIIRVSEPLFKKAVGSGDNKSDPQAHQNIPAPFD